MPTTSSSWFVLTITVGAAAVVMMMTIGIAVDDAEIRSVEGQTIGSKTDPVMVLDGTGKGIISCSNNNYGDNSTSSSSSTAAQITFKALGFPRGTYADIIGGGTVRYTLLILVLPVQLIFQWKAPVALVPSIQKALRYRLAGLLSNVHILLL